MLETHRRITTKDQLTGVIVIHRGDFTVQHCFIDDAPGAEIEHLCVRTNAISYSAKQRLEANYLSIQID